MVALHDSVLDGYHSTIFSACCNNTVTSSAQIVPYIIILRLNNFFKGTVLEAYQTHVAVFIQAANVQYQSLSLPDPILFTAYPYKTHAFPERIRFRNQFFYVHVIRVMPHFVEIFVLLILCINYIHGYWFGMIYFLFYNIRPENA